MLKFCSAILYKHARLVIWKMIIILIYVCVYTQKLHVQMLDFFLCRNWPEQLKLIHSSFITCSTSPSLSQSLKWEREGHTPPLLQSSMSTYSIPITTHTYSFVCLLSVSEMERDCTIAHSLSLFGVCALQVEILFFLYVFFLKKKDRERCFGSEEKIIMIYIQRNLKVFGTISF